jgi:carbonic anhydrase/acetyltransferase-like protein (isoleucine patch superfamily)
LEAFFLEAFFLEAFFLEAFFLEAFFFFVGRLGAFFLAFLRGAFLRAATRFSTRPAPVVARAGRYTRDMASRTVVDSVERVNARVAVAERLEEELALLRAAHPGAIFDRYLDQIPRLGARVRVASGAALVGDVSLGEDVSIWYGCVLRGDVNRIEIGPRSNVQDGAVVHLGDSDPTVIEADVVIGHRAVLHGCRVGAGTLIGIQATVLDGARIGAGSVVGAGALVTAGAEIPPRSLVLGVPGRVIRSLDGDSERFHRALAAKYVRLSHNYQYG